MNRGGGECYSGSEPLPCSLLNCHSLLHFPRKGRGNVCSRYFELRHFGHPAQIGQIGGATLGLRVTERIAGEGRIDSLESQAATWLGHSQKLPRR